MNSERLYFRKFSYDDFDDLYEILSNPNVCRYLPGEGGRNKEQVDKWITHFIRSFENEKGTRIYAILEKGNDTVIGYGGLGHVKEFDAIEIMYGFHEDAWGKGYATETSLVMKNLAIELGIKHLIALADVNNIPSQKILLKTGYKQVKQIKIWGLECYYYELEL